MTGCLFKGIIIQSSHVGNPGGFGRGKMRGKFSFVFPREGSEPDLSNIAVSILHVGTLQISLRPGFQHEQTSKAALRSAAGGSEVTMQNSFCGGERRLSTGVPCGELG